MFATIGRCHSRTLPYLVLMRIEPAYPSRRRSPVRIVLLTIFAYSGMRCERWLPTTIPMRARYPGTRGSEPTKTLLTIVA